METEEVPLLLLQQHTLKQLLQALAALLVLPAREGKLLR
jgi:hypothetical protein